MSDERLKMQYAAPPPPGAPPAYEDIQHSKWPLYMAATATLLSSTGYLAYLFKTEQKLETVYIEKPITIEKIIEVPVAVEKIVYVDRLIERNDSLITQEVYIDPYDGL